MMNKLAVLFVFSPPFRAAYCEVLVWDTAKEGSAMALTNDGLTLHADAVTEVRWALGLGTTTTLASSSRDGQVIFWKISPKLSSYQVIERYKCDSKAGVTCFAFPQHKSDTFVAALEGGALALCSTTAARAITPATDLGAMDEAKDPVMSCFEPQSASVSALEFSPHHDNLFATVATDQAIRIYSLFQNCAQHVVWCPWPVVGLGWSPSQANVIAVWGQSAQVAVFNSTTGHSLSVLSPGNLGPNTAISAAAFNFKSPRLLAVGGLDGITRVWKVPSHFRS